MGAGILPIAIKDNQIYILFGKENKYNDTQGWADFGGGIEKSENILDAAIREGWEESTGFLGDPKEMKKKILNNNKMFLEIDNYKTFILPMEYDEQIVEYFNKSQNCIQNNLSKKMIKSTFIFEKQEIKWFNINELKHKLHFFRSFYQEMVNVILLNEKIIKDNIYMKHYFKGKKSKTHRGRKDFTTKKSSKYHQKNGHWLMNLYKPFQTKKNRRRMRGG